MTRTQIRTYTVLIPARNEENNIVRVLESITKQSILPKVVVVVSDGSTDNTIKRIHEYSRVITDFPIQVFKIKDRGFNAVGTPYITDAFNVGLRFLKTVDADFLLILGADSTMDPEYMEKIMQEYHTNNKLAITSGYCPDEPSTNQEHVYGSGRVIRYDFFRKIGFKIPFIYGWESSILYTAKAGGYDVYHFNEPKMYRLRIGGVRRKSYIGWGKGNRTLGYHFFVVVARSVRLSKVYGIRAGIQLIAGFFMFNPFSYQTPVRRWVRHYSKWRIKQAFQKVLP